MTTLTLVPDTTGRQIIHAVAARHGLTAEDLIGRSQARHVVIARRKAALSVANAFPDKSMTALGRLFHRNRGAMRYMLIEERKRQKTVQTNSDHEDYILEVEAQMRRICGLNLVHQVAHALEIYFFEAMMLSILMENYPRVMTYEQLLEAYEAAHERLYQDKTSPKSDTLVRTFCQNIRRHFRNAELPNPVHVISPRGLILSHDAAVWLAGKFGKPVAISSPVRLIA